MNRLMKLVLLMPLAGLLLTSAAAAQSPYPSPLFARESNSEGSTDYVLRPAVEEIHKKSGGKDKPYQLVAAVARPAKQAAVLLFLNAQKEIQFRPGADASVIITVDSVDISNLKYELATTSDEAGGITLQIANVLISLQDLQRIAKGGAVSLKLGAVLHRIDKDNLNALRHLASEIEKDLAKAP